MKRAMSDIQDELQVQLNSFTKQGKLLEEQRLRMRTTFDLEMMEQLGFCSGIENYSRHLDGRDPGSPPNCLLDYFPEDFLVVIDESHVTVPQIGAMYEGDAARKRTLVEHGFRLPSALDNRPLKWPEFLERTGQKVYLSATPGKYERGGRLPCYDLAPVTSFSLGSSLRLPTLGTPDSHGLTGGVCKVRERIHRIIADIRLLAIPASRSRVADCDLN